MMVALTFATPALLIGLAAAAIPFVLHLLSSVRAQDMMFPTLRFLRMSMEKTARRRRLQHWLLLVLRAALFFFLAVAIADPISGATGGWLKGQTISAAVVLDNSYSMAASGQRGARFDQAKAEALALVGGEQSPTLGMVLTTVGSAGPQQLSATLSTKEVDRARIGYGPPALAERLREALEELEDAETSRKAIYLFTDLQRSSFEKLAALDDWARVKDVHLLVVNTAEADVQNVGISDLKITGRRVVDSALEFAATLVNSSPTDRTVDVALEINGVEVRRVPKVLRAVGRKGSSATVRFGHRFRQAGEVTGRVLLAHGDDLPLDNVRWFSLTVGGRVKALIVPGPADESDTGGLEPATMLRLALEPYEDPTRPWPIRPRTVAIADLTAADLEAAGIALFCDVPKFTDPQAKAVEAFTAAGGTAVFFLGPKVDPNNYNELFVQRVRAEGGLLPGRLGEAVGEVGPGAASVGAGDVRIDHPYFAGLYEDRADYLSVLVQRYYRLKLSAQPGQTLVRLANGEPLLQVKPFGSGRVVLCTTAASPKWSNLPITGLFLPMVARMSLLARPGARRDEIYLPGKRVTVRADMSGRPPLKAGEKLFVRLTPPEGAGPAPAPKAMIQTPQGYQATYDPNATAEPGLYRWDVVLPGGEPGPSGSFVVNPFGPECKLDSMPPNAFQSAMKARGLERVYVASTLADVHAAATKSSENEHWWDYVAAVVILVLVFEAIVANRRARQEVVPSHLIPGAAG